LAKIFTILDKYNIIVDLISTSEVHVSMALGAEVVDNSLETARAELEKLGMVS
jgi:aspartate kinase